MNGRYCGNINWAKSQITNIEEIFYIIHIKTAIAHTGTKLRTRET
jgi:hypothetical protein